MMYELGEEVRGWTSAQRPSGMELSGQRVVLRRMERADAPALFESLDCRNHVHDWHYMPFGPFESVNELRDWIDSVKDGLDPMFYTMFGADNDLPFGFCSFMNIRPEAGSIEVGCIQVAPDFQRSTDFTEAMYLMAVHAFSLGYRRYEWKCDALNVRSRRAAHRLGFSYEGMFRQALVVKGRNRDTKWFSIIDRDWPDVSQALRAWLSPGNFDGAGRQRRSLSRMTAPLVVQFDPDLPEPGRSAPR